MVDASALDFDPRKIPPDYLQAIGSVVAVSAQTEDILGWFIGSLLGIDNIQSMALAVHMNIPQKSNVIKSLAELESPYLNDLDHIDDLLDNINKAFEKRNTIVHNSLAMNPHTNAVFSYRIKAKGSLQIELSPISVEEIKQIASDIYESGIKVVDFMTSRGLPSITRTKPLREAVDRSKKARDKRRNTSELSKS